MVVEVTFCMIKPNSVKNKNIGAILDYLEKEGFCFLRMQHMQLTPSFCEVFYQEHKDRDFFSSLIDFITSGPVVALALSRENACMHLREIMGATDPKKAKPSTIRALFGQNVEQNAIHGSDSLQSVSRELTLFFPEEKF